MGKAARRKRLREPQDSTPRPLVMPGWEKLEPEQLDAIADLVRSRAVIEGTEAAIARTVAAARAEGLSWSMIGAAMGMTGEGVRKKYRDT